MSPVVLRPSNDGPPAVTDPSRVAAVRSTGLLDSAPQDSLDGLTALAARLLRTPLAFLTLVDDQRSFRLSQHGVDPAAGREQPVGHSFCQYVLDSAAPLLVTDARADPRTRDNPAVELFGIRSYAGFPVLDEDGNVLGSFCAVDVVARDWVPDDVEVLRVLAEAARAQIGQLRALAAGRRAEERLERLASVTVHLAGADSIERLTEVVISQAMPVLGVDGGAVLLRVGERLHLTVSDRLNPRVKVVYGDLPMDSPLPAPHVVRTGERLVLANRAEGMAFHPVMDQVYDDTERDSWVFSPLVDRGVVLGSLAVCWVAGRDHVPVDELDLIDAFAAQCATALARLRAEQGQREAQAAHEAQRRRAEIALQAQARVLELIAGGAAVDVVLSALARWVEQSLEDQRCSVLLLEDRAAGQVLTVAAAPSMLPVFRTAVDGMSVAVTFSPCSTAVSAGEPVLVPDMLAVPQWAPMHLLARQLGVRSCWSFPVRSPATGRPLGTFALYGTETGLPDDETTALVARASHLVGITVDRHQLVASLDHQARHDVLTGLPNRFQLIETLEGMLRRAADGTGAAPVVVFLDLDRLKVINDSLGHEIGDVLLVDMAQRLRAAVSPLDMVARFGGDEFVVLSSQQHGQVDVDRLAGSILDVIAQPLVLEGRLISPAASAGVLVATAGQSATEVLRDADIAMYRAKHAGGGGYALFGDTMRQRAFDRLDMEGQVRHGLEHGEFRVHYQPIVDMADGDRVLGFEALVRWEHPQRGLLGPDQFITLAEETGLVVPLGEWVLRTAVDTARRWSACTDTEGLTMSVNLTAQQLHIAGLVALVRECQDSMAPWSLGLELTESTLMDDTPTITAVIEELAASGARLNIDDFGTGFSSLAYLTRLPVRRLKVDRSFVADLQRKPEATTVVAAIVGLADKLGLSVVAEGIETEAQRASLLAMGCQFGQGYLFGRPVPDEQALAMLTGRVPRQRVRRSG